MAAAILSLGAFVAGARLGAARPHPQNFDGVPGAVDPGLIDGTRAQERGRGRRANSPEHIPWRGWKDILIRCYFGFSDCGILSLAAGVAFYDLLAIFPAVTALVSIYGLFADASEFEHKVAALVGLVPATTLDIIHEQIEHILKQSTSRLSLTFIGGVLLSLWSANAGVKALFDGLNVIYAETEKRSFVRFNIASFIFTAGVIVFTVVSMGGIIVLTPLLSRLGIDHLIKGLVSALNWLFLFAIASAGLSALYRFGPSRRPAKWRWLSVGSVVGALSWLVGSAAFSWYLARFANYGVAYGSLGAAIGLMIWMWLTAIAVLLGALLNAEIEHQTARDSTVGHIERPLGRRGATMADTVGEAQG